MSALPPKQIRAMEDAAAAIPTNRAPDAFAAQWKRLHDQAAELSQMAGMAQEAALEMITNFPDDLALAGPDQRALVWQGIEDIDAMMQPGLTALRIVASRGQNASAPAMALWREFHRSRTALLTLTKTGVDRAA